MNLLSKVLGVVVFLGLGLVSAAGATTFNVNNRNEFDTRHNLYDQMTFSQEGLSLTVTAWRGNNDAADRPWIYDSLFNNGPNDNSGGREYSGNAHWQEGLFFTFSQSVELTSIGFGHVDENDKMEVFNYSTMDSLGIYNLSGSVNFDDPLKGTTFLVTPTDRDDNFSLNRISTAPITQSSGATVPTPSTVPVPSTVLLLGAGLAGLVGFRKRVTA